MRARLSPAERAALERARERFLAWRADWYDGGAAFNPKTLAELRKAARAFHEALQALLSASPIDGTRARLLVRMQQRELHQHPQAYYYDRLREALFTALTLDMACATDVKRGTKADTLARAWTWQAADEWQAATGKAPASGRFGSVLLDFTASAKGLPPLGGIEQVKAALASWRAARKRQ